MKNETPKILIYSRRGIELWSSTLCDYLTKNGFSVYTFSELRNISDITLADNFYKYYSSNTEKSKFSAIEIIEIVKRCRLLRSLPIVNAKIYINSMSLALDYLIDNHNPNFIIGLRVDSYVLDLLERKCQLLGIKYVGIWKSAFIKNYSFITSRGELNFLGFQDNKVLNKAKILDKTFKATSISNNYEFSIYQNLKIKIYYIFRSYFHFFYRYAISDKLGYRYLTNGIHVPEYRLNLFELNYNKFIKNDWNSYLNNNLITKNIFIALQVNPESTIDYYVKDLGLIEYEKVIIKILNNFSKSDYRIFIKDHPNMFGRRNFSFLNKISSYDNVRFLPYHIDSTYLLDRVFITFTWSGTVSVQAALNNKISIVVNPPYFVENLFLQIHSIQDIDNIINKINNFKFPSNLESRQDELITLINSSLLKGELNFRNIDKNLYQSILELIIKLNSHL